VEWSTPSCVAQDRRGYAPATIELSSTIFGYALGRQATFGKRRAGWSQAGWCVNCRRRPGITFYFAAGKRQFHGRPRL